MKSTKTLLVAAALVCGSFTTGAFAQTKGETENWEKSWRHLEIERSAKNATNGPACQDSLTSRGEGKALLGKFQIWAKSRTRKNWEDAATKLFGVEYASWRKAKGKSEICEKKTDLLHCKVTAFPCK